MADIKLANTFKFDFSFYDFESYDALFDVVLLDFLRIFKLYYEAFLFFLLLVCWVSDLKVSVAAF
jgi:hypothetical protein